MAPADPPAEVVVRRDGAVVARWPLPCNGGKVDLRAVDALARLLLRARRQGCTVGLRRPCRHLVELLELVGLAGPLQVGREAEDGEEAGVEEVVVADDPVA